MTVLLTGTQLGDFVIGEQVNKGGMGAIYRVFKPNSRDPYVAKVLLPAFSADEQFRKRFQREISLLQTLQHPHIIPIVDFGEQDDLLYFVMPYINGQSLAILLTRHTFSPGTAWLILEPTMQALAYAHDHHIIHRDLKPDNILVELKSAHPFLADFGLSKSIDKSTMTQAGISIGTPQYMAPEQVRAQAVSPRTDVYALGVVAYEMLLGRVPFNEGSPDVIAFKHIREAPPPPRSLNPAFPAAVEVVILRALAKNPADRFETATAFSRAYWEALESLTPEARKQHYWKNS